MLVENWNESMPAARATFLALGDRSLFAWHHPPAPRLRRDAGILLCPALGYEYMSAHRTYRILAERLAAIGFDVLRFDYDGTGNSSGGPADRDRLVAWLRSIDRAMAELRSLSASNDITLIGLRGGAL